MAYDENPDLVDRAAAAAIAGIFAVPIGWGLQAIVSMFGAELAAVFWLPVLSFSLFGFVLPRQSRNFHTAVWHGIIGLLRDLRLYW